MNNKTEKIIKIKNEYLENMFRILDKIDFDYSFENNYILWSTEIDLNDYHKKYSEFQDRLTEMRLISSFHFPSLSENILLITSYTSQLWGQQQNLLGNIKEKHLPFQETLNQICNLCNKIGNEIKKAKNILIDLNCESRHDLKLYNE